MPFKFSEIPDGSGATVLIVEASGRHVPWTEPRDVDIATAARSVNGPGKHWGYSDSVLSSYHSGGAHVAMADGSVRFISENVNSTVVLHLLQVDDGVVEEF